jgi:hypothetical protein
MENMPVPRSSNDAGSGVCVVDCYMFAWENNWIVCLVSEQECPSRLPLGVVLSDSPVKPKNDAIADLAAAEV